MNFLHSGNCGDIIAHLPAMKALMSQERETQATLLLGIGQRAGYAPNVRHPLGGVTLDRKFAEQLIPLLQAQPYIRRAAVHAGEEVDYNLDEFRKSGFDHAMGSIHRYPCHVWAINPCLWEPWLTVTPSKETSGAILVNKTSRYSNKIEYGFLSRYPDVRFVGLWSEYTEFRKKFGAFCDCQVAPDFLTLASWIAGCRCFVGNQSFAFNLAEALKVPRVVEVSPQAPNLIPCGANGYEGWGQEGFERAVEGAVETKTATLPSAAVFALT